MGLQSVYREEWRKIRGEYRGWIGGTAGLFVFVVCVSFFYLVRNPAQAENILALAARKLPPVRPGEGIIGIVLVRNVLATALIAFSGAITGGVLPLLNLVANGFIIVTMLPVLAAKMGVHPLRVLLIGILPHGLFELPALILAGALGLRLGAAVVRRLAGQGSAVGGTVRESLATYLRVVLPLLCIAALLEGTLTVWLVQRFLPV